MVKVDIIRAIQLREKIPFWEAEKMVNELLEIVKQALESGDSVMVSGFGKFELRDKPQRPGRDPKSKKEYTIAERRVITFYPSRVWRNEISS